MMNESVKKSLEKSKNVLEEKRKIVKQKICIKRHTFTIIAMNFVQEQLTTNEESGWVKLTASLLQPQLPSKHQQFRAA